jgi:hypothetical protein
MRITSVRIKKKIAVGYYHSAATTLLLVYDVLPELQMWSRFSVLMHPAQHHGHITVLVPHVFTHCALISSGCDSLRKLL